MSEAHKTTIQKAKKEMILKPSSKYPALEANGKKLTYDPRKNEKDSSTFTSKEFNFKCGCNSEEVSEYGTRVRLSFVKMARPNGYQNGEVRKVKVEELSEIGFHVINCAFFTIQFDFQQLPRNVSLFSNFYDTTTEQTMEVSSIDKSKFFKNLQQSQTFGNKFSSPIKMPPAVSTIPEANNESSTREISLTELGDTLMESEDDIQPAFGTADDVLEAFLRHGLVNWGPEVDEFLKTGQLLARETTNEENPGFTKAIFTGAPNTGKTYLAARIAKDAGFPFIRVCTPQKMIGLSQAAKCQTINRMFNDAYKSPLSILIIDDLERLMDYTPIGPSISNLVLQALLVLLNQEPPKGHRLLVLATSSSVEFLREVDLLSRFPKVIRVRQLRHLDELLSVCDEANLFRDDELQWIKHELGKLENLPQIGIKSLLQVLAFVRASDERAKTFVSEIEELCLGL